MSDVVVTHFKYASILCDMHRRLLESIIVASTAFVNDYFLLTDLVIDYFPSTTLVNDYCSIEGFCNRLFFHRDLL